MTQLHYAAARGDLAAVRQHLESAVDVRDDESRTPLMLAAARRGPAGRKVIECLLAAGADVNASSRDGTTALLAASRGDLATIEMLLAAGADARAGSAGGSALTYATIWRPDAGVVEALLAAGADPNATTDYGELPVKYASAAGAFEIVRTLIAAGADAKPLEWTPLMHAIALGDSPEVERALGADEGTGVDHRGRTPLHLALFTGDLAKIELLHAGASSVDQDLGKALRDACSHNMVTATEWLLAHGAEVEGVSKCGDTPLIEASEGGSTDCLRILLAAGADVEHQNEFETKAIDVADDIEIARLLVEAGTDIDFINGQGFNILQSAAADDAPFVADLLELGAAVDASNIGATALHAAAVGDNVVAVEILLAAGADPDAQDVDGDTPLGYAKSVECATMLLAAGARVDLEDDIGQVVFQQQREPAILDLLLRHGCEVDTGASESGGALMRAATDGVMDRIELLLDRGADPNLSNEHGEVALMFAVEGNHAECARLLIALVNDVDHADAEGRTALFRAVAPEGFTTYEVAMMLVTSEVLDEADRPDLASCGFVASDSTAIVDALIAAGAAVDAQDEDGVTALMLTASCGRPARIEALLRYGADPNRKDQQGRTARDHAGAHPDTDLRRQIMALLRNSSST